MPGKHQKAYILDKYQICIGKVACTYLLNTMCKYQVGTRYILGIQVPNMNPSNTRFVLSTHQVSTSYVPIMYLLYTRYLLTYGTCIATKMFNAIIVDMVLDYFI